MTKFPLFQLHVAHRLGVSEERVRELRLDPAGPLQEGRDWVKKGQRLLFATEAVDRLAAVLGVPEKTPPERRLLLPWSAQHRIIVVQVWRNPHYVCGALANGSGPVDGFAPLPKGSFQLLRVRVRSSENLLRGMVLECVHIGGDLYEATKLPRRKGRW